MKKTIAYAAACATALTPIFSTAALAFTLGTATIDDPAPLGADEADLELACDAIATGKGPRWSAELKSYDNGTITSGPTADGAPYDIENLTGVGPQIGETIQVYGDPYRVGGSVNMFGMAEVISARWTDSTYDFNQDFTWQTTYNFVCSMTEEVDTPALGIHNWTGPSTAGAQAILNCEGDKNPRPEEDRGANCEWEQTIPAGTEDQPRDDESGFIVVNEGGTLAGFESSGGSIPVDPDAVDAPDVQVVVCISPGPKGGTWKKQNGYVGDKCTTAWYNTKPVGSQDNINDGSNNIVTIPS